VNHADDEVHEQPKEAAVENVVTHAEGFPGGPHDTLFFINYVYHVATKVWNEEVFIFLNK